YTSATIEPRHTYRVVQPPRGPPAKRRRPSVRSARGACRCAERGNRGGLQPINPGRLLVARLVLKADAQEIAGFEHLPRGLRETGLIAVERRDRGEPRHIKQQTQRGEQRVGPDSDEPDGVLPHLSGALWRRTASQAAADAKPVASRAARHG